MFEGALNTPAFRLHLLRDDTHPSKHSSWGLDEDEYILINIRLQKTSSTRLQDVLVKTNIFVLSIRLQDVFKTSSKRLQGVSQIRLEDIFKTF